MNSTTLFPIFSPPVLRKKTCSCRNSPRIYGVYGSERSRIRPPSLIGSRPFTADKTRDGSDRSQVVCEVVGHETAAAVRSFRLLGMSMVVWGPIGRALLQIAGAFVVVYLALKLNAFCVERAGESIWEDEMQPGTFGLFRKSRKKVLFKFFFGSLQGPATIFLPLVALVHSTHALVDMTDELLHACATCEGIQRLENAIHLVMPLLTKADRILWDIIAVVGILLIVWFAVLLKDQYVNFVLEQRSRSDPNILQDLRAIILPVNALSTWIFTGIGAVVTFVQLGINVRPLLALGGVSGLVVGLAAQSVVANMISGINLFLSRPFVPGDRIEVFSGNGSRIISGVVEHINPLRTIVRTDKAYPIAVPNKTLADLIIGNESRTVKKMSVGTEGGRRIAMTVKMSFECLSNVPDIQFAINKMLSDWPGINTGLGYGASISSISDSGIVLEIQGTCVKRSQTSFDECRIKLLMRIKELLEEKGITDAKLMF